MIENIKAWLKPTSPDPDIAHRQYILNIVLLGLAAPSFVFGIVMTVLWIAGITPIAGVIAGLGVQPFYILAYWLSGKGRVTAAAYILTMVVFLVMTGASFQVGVGHITTIGLAMVVTIAGILIDIRAAILFVILSVVTYVLTGVAQASGLVPTALLPEAAVAADAVGLGLGLTIIVIFNWLSNREMADALARGRDLAGKFDVQTQNLEKQVEDRTMTLERQAAQIRATAEIAKLASETSDPHALMSRAVEIIREHFGVYHASIFTMDNSGVWAQLTASTGIVGRRMLARRHRLAVGSASIIGWVTASLKPRLAQDVEEDPFFFRNPLLPDTRCEIAVPLLVGDELLGVLDVQSTEPQAFSMTEVRTMEAIASELAVGIERARVERDMRLQLERIERAYRGQVRDVWGRLIRAGIPAAFRLSPAGELISGSEEGFSSIEPALREARTIITSDGSEVSVPIQVRGEVLAAIAARKPVDGSVWADEDIALIEAVAGQAALALESAWQRSEERRRVAELEVINRVSQAVSQMLNLDQLYRIVHSQINQLIGKADMIITLYDKENEEISFPYISVGGELKEFQPSKLGHEINSLIIISQRPLLLVEDVKQRATELGVEKVDDAPKSWLGVPMMIGEEIIGGVAIQDQELEHRFTEDDTELLTTIASQIAVAIQNTSLVEQIKRSARRERLIHEITREVRRSPDIGTILETTVREIGRSLHAAKATVRLGEKTRGDQQPADSENKGDQDGG